MGSTLFDSGVIEEVVRPIDRLTPGPLTTSHARPSLEAEYFEPLIPSYSGMTSGSQS